MCANRVEELESQVQELEASVEGLTEELLECKVRLRELEDEVGVETEYAAAEPTETAEEADRSKPEAAAGEEKAEDPEAEIIVA
ncbi:MAG: bZIP transcription factor [Salinirussus sp.]